MWRIEIKFDQTQPLNYYAEGEYILKKIASGGSSLLQLHHIWNVHCGGSLINCGDSPRVVGRKHSIFGKKLENAERGS